MGGGADVARVHDPDRRLVGELGTYPAPAREDRRRREERDRGRDEDRDRALPEPGALHDRRQPRPGDRDDGGDEVEQELPRAVGHVELRERDAVPGDRPGDHALREMPQLVLARKGERQCRGRADQSAEEHPLGRLALVAGVADVHRRDRHHDSGDDDVQLGEAAGDEDHDADGDAADDGRGGGLAEAGIERFEIARGGDGREEEREDDEGENRIAHEG